MTSHVVDRLRAVVEAQPAAVAIACAGEPVLSYATLWSRASAIARQLVEAGAEAGSLIALHVEKSPDFVVGMIASWLAGAAWVPLLPESPEARRRLIVDETRARVALVASDRVPPWLAQSCRVIDLRAEAIATPEVALAERRVIDLSASGVRAIEAARSIEDRAYVIYTSGSTGQPKGVVVSHRGLVPMLDAQIAAFELRVGDRCLWLLSPGFDASVSDVGTALLAGATLHIEHPARLQSASGLLEVVRQRAITHVDLPPSLLPLLPADQAPPSLRTLIVGGEVCAPAAIRAWAERVRVVNVYGPTEATVCTSLCICDRRWNRPLLGAALPHVAYEVVDDELWITGPGVADGYLDRPDLEAAKFVWRDHRRWFRTGDRVRVVDGELEFVGRIDRQLKIAGVLVAPEEIEARLREHPDLTDVAVVAGPLGTRDPVVASPLGTRDALIAYYVAVRDLATELRDHLATRLDARLIPRRFTRVDAIPRTASGKPALPELLGALADRGQVLQPGELHGRGQDLPLQPGELAGLLDPNVKSSTECVLARIWTQLLGVTPAAEDQFFALGGDSLAVIEHVGLAELAGLAMTAGQLYAHPTLTELAAAIDAGAPDTAMTCQSLIDDLAILRLVGNLMVGQPLMTPDFIFDRFASSALPEIVLTGATGFLGSHVLVELVARSNASIVCLVREPTRLIPALRAIGGDRAIAALASRVRVIQGDLTAPRLGVSEALWSQLADAHAIVHCAADVSLVGPYRALRAANVEGTARVLELAAAGRSKRVHHASTLSVFVGGDRAPGTLRETDALETAARLHGGYAQSKWAAEYLAREAGATIYRFGLLTGDTRTGRAPSRDWLTWFLRGLARVGAVPRMTGELAGDNRERISTRDSQDATCAPMRDPHATRAPQDAAPIRDQQDSINSPRVDITPIDYASRAFVDLVLAGAEGTFHIANRRSATLDDLVRALRRAGVALDEVAPETWPATVAAAELESSPEVAAAVLGLIRIGHGYTRVRACDVFQATGYTFDTSRTDALVGPCPPPSPELLDRYVVRALEVG